MKVQMTLHGKNYIIFKVCTYPGRWKALWEPFWLFLWTLRDRSMGAHLWPFLWFFVSQSVDVVKVDPQAFQKNQKRHFFRDFEKSFQEVTPIGPEPHQFFSFWNISTNKIARGIQSFGRNGPWLAGWLSNGQNFHLKFAQTCDEQMLKISCRYLNSFLI